jgi:hypothetical protein
MNKKEYNRIKFISWEFLILAVTIWIGSLLTGTSENSNLDQYSALIADNFPDDETSAKLSDFLDFVSKNKTRVNKQYVNRGLVYLSGVLGAMIKNHYSENAAMLNLKENLLKTNAKILNEDSMYAENLRKSLILSSKIISKIQSIEFPDLNEAAKELENAAMEVGSNESFDVIKYRTADYFEKSSEIFIAMVIIKARRNNEVKERFYEIKST